MRIFLACLLILTAVPLYAQDEQLDSLNSIIRESQDASEVFAAMIAASQYQAGYDNDDSRNYALKALKNAELRKSDPDMALAYKWIGISYYYQLKPFEALENFENAFVLFEKVGDKSGMANMRQLQAETNTLEGDANRGLELGLEALALINQTDDEYRKASIMVALGNAYNDKEESSNEAISYYKQALPIFERIEYSPGVGNVLQNLGDAYRAKGQYQQARTYYFESLEAHDDPYEAPSKLLALGITYMQLGMFDEATENMQQSKQLAAKNEADLEVAQALIAEGELAFRQKKLPEAESSYREALAIIKQNSSSSADYKIELREAYEGLSVVLSSLGNYREAFEYQALLTAVKDSLHDSDNKKTMDLTNANFVNEQQKAELAVQEATLETQRLQRNAFLGGFVLVFVIAFIIYRNYRNKVKTNKLLDRQNEEIEGLLLNILPAEVASELQHHGHATPRDYESATVLFADFKGFTKISADLKPHELIAELNSYFNEFDDIIDKHNLEKIKTIGDSYMCAGGLPKSNNTHAFDAVRAGLAMQKYIARKNEKRLAAGLVPWELRVGIHTGPVVAGVVGRKKYAYDIWGDAVNIASRMETNGESDKVNISEATRELVKDEFNCVPRGKISVKGAGERTMYFVEEVEQATV